MYHWRDGETVGVGAAVTATAAVSSCSDWPTDSRRFRIILRPNGSSSSSPLVDLFRRPLFFAFRYVNILRA